MYSILKSSGTRSLRHQSICQPAHRPLRRMHSRAASMAVHRYAGVGCAGVPRVISVEVRLQAEGRTHPMNDNQATPIPTEFMVIIAFLPDTNNMSAMQAFRLDGKVAIVTGSSRGIGRSIAEHLAEAGAKVVVSSRKGAACDEVVTTIRAKGGQAIAIPANIGERAQLESLVQETRKQWGQVGILVCNAASNPYYGPMATLPDDAFNKILQNNIVSNLWLANLVLPEMAQRREGALIIVSSIGGLKGSPVLGAYCVSKAADMQLARNLAVEWGKHNVRVNCIAPGLVKTDFARALWDNPAHLQQVLATTPLGRIGEPEDIGAIAVFLASKAAAFITGQTIVADGGVTIAG